jgi:predicted phage terminase large subunit-like protein
LPDISRKTTLSVLGVNPTQHKATRARAESAAIDCGLVSLPKEAAWLNDFEREVTLFLKAGHDDHVDGLTMFLARFKAQEIEPEFNIRRL